MLGAQPGAWREGDWIAFTPRGSCAALAAYAAGARA